MLDIFGDRYGSCDGLSRRGFRWIGVVGLGGLALAIVASASVALGGPPKSLDEIQGRWRLVSIESLGKDLPARDGTLELKGNAFIQKKTIDLDKRRIKIDTSRVPAAIDQIMNEGTAKEWKIEAVFEVSDSRLIICFGPRPTGERPKSLEFIPGKRTSRNEYQRLSPAPPRGAPIADQLEGRWLKTQTLTDVPRPADIRIPKTILEIKGGMTGGESEVIDEYQITLHPGSPRADLFRASFNQTCRGIVDYDPEKQELKVCYRAPQETDYPTEFVSKAEDKSTLLVFQREKAKSP